MLRDALSEVMQVLPLRLKVVVEEITAFMEEQNKEVPGLAKIVFKSIGDGHRREGFETVDHGSWKRRTEQR